MGISKVLVLITSDLFANTTDTIEEAQKQHNLRYIQIWVLLFVKDRSLYNSTVANAIASKPSCSHAIEIFPADVQTVDFKELLQDIFQSVEKTSAILCNEPKCKANVKGSLGAQGRAHMKDLVDPKVGKKFKLSGADNRSATVEGNVTVTLFVSLTEENPNEEMYDYKAVANATSSVELTVTPEDIAAALAGNQTVVTDDGATGTTGTGGTRRRRRRLTSSSSGSVEVSVYSTVEASGGSASGETSFEFGSEEPVESTAGADSSQPQSGGARLEGTVNMFILLGLALCATFYIL